MCQTKRVSFTDVFPIMDDGMVESFEKQATADEKERLRLLFAVQSIHNSRATRHLISTSLFWKPACSSDGDFPEPTEELMRDPGRFGIKSRFENAWEHYVAPVTKAARQLARDQPEMVYRVYLAKDLEFLLPELLEAGCEVHLMKTSSILHNPGAMWRFLAMEDDCLVTLSDSDRAEEMEHDIERTKLVAEGGLQFWRAPYSISNNDADVGAPGGYRTASAGQMGCAKSLPIRMLCEAFIWNCEQGVVRDHCVLKDRRVKVFGSKFPEFGFDEFFLNAVVFPRAAFEGIFTFVSWKGNFLNQWLALDIEYCTWANPKSEIMFFGEVERDQDGEQGHG